MRAILIAAVVGIPVVLFACSSGQKPQATGRLTLELIGDGVTPRYTDSERGEITLHSRESLTAVANALDDSNLSEIRFRSNIAIEGAGEWEEQAWVGKQVRIGALEFDVGAAGRCRAT